MTGLTISRGFGLVAVLAVSGTALFLAYGYKKKTCLNIRRGKGCLKYVHRGGEPLKKEGAISVELSKGKDNGKGGVYMPQMARRPQKPIRSSLRTHEPTREELIKEKLVKCPDADPISSLHKDAHTSFRAADHLVEQLENGSDMSSLKSADLSDRLDNLNKGAENLSGESTFVSGGRILEDFHERRADLDVLPYTSPVLSQEEQTSNAVSVDVPSPASPLSSQDEQRGEAICFTPPPSNAISNAHSPPKFALVGCFVSSGGGATGKVAGRQKKQVRFSPSVAEPSSNNHDYRRRGGQQRGGAQTAVQEQSSEAIRTIGHTRPRLYSQAAKQTITYNVGRFAYISL